MFRSLIFSLIIFSSVFAQANTFLGLGASGRIVKNDEGNYDIKVPVLIYGGYKEIPWAYALEGLYFQDKSNAGGNFKITNSVYEASAYAMRFFNYEEARAINPYAVGGLGVFQSHVETDFNGSVSNDKSKFNPALKLGVGAWAQVGTKGFITLEAKGMYSAYYSPDLIFDLSFRAGVEF